LLRLEIACYFAPSRLALDAHCSPKKAQFITFRGINSLLRPLVFDGSLKIFHPVLCQKSRKPAALLYQGYILLTHDGALRDLYQKIRPLLLPPRDKPRRKIGFVIKEKRATYAKRAKRKKATG
jgi:hypothetical protein